MHLKPDTNEGNKASGILVPCTGLVILNGSFKTLFERLNLLDGDNFIDQNRQIEAIQYLQYVAVGSCEAEEADLALSKIMVGLPLDHPITSSYGIKDIKENEDDVIQGMLNAAIDHWAAIGKSSIQGFRGNWLVREGLIYEKEEYWNLVIEKRAYDILLNQSPFSFSIIKFPWMPKPLKVEWSC